MAPRWPPGNSKMVLSPRRRAILLRWPVILISSLCFVFPILSKPWNGPRWARDRPKIAPRWPQDSPKMAPRGDLLSASLGQWRVLPQAHFAGGCWICISLYIYIEREKYLHIHIYTHIDPSIFVSTYLLIYLHLHLNLYTYFSLSLAISCTQRRTVYV